MQVGLDAVVHGVFEHFMDLSGLAELLSDW